MDPEAETFTVSQVDPRTPLWFKHAFTGATLGMSILTCASLPWLSGKCTNPTPTPRVWVAFSLIAFLSCFVLSLFCVYIFIYWRYAWLKTVRHRPVGYDREDADPFIYARTGRAIARDGNQHYSHMLDVMHQSQLKMQHMDNEYAYNQTL